MTSRVWSTFFATRSDGSSVKLMIQDLPKDRVDDAVGLFIKYFIREEAFPKAAGIVQNPAAVEEARLLLTKSLSDPAAHTVVCRAEAADGAAGQIVGVSATSLVTVGSKPFDGVKPKTKEVKTFCNLMEIVSYFHKRMEDLGIYTFYDDRDMIVHPDFRKLGIGMQFWKARRMACVEHNVAATGALVTSKTIQNIAEKENWQSVLEINLDEFGRKHGVTFDDGGVHKFMIWRNPGFQQNVE